MLRMGRSSKSEQPAERADFQENSYSANYNSPQENVSISRATTETDSMARDIKEGRLSGFVGYGTVLTGETSFQAMLRVDGHLTGRITSESGTLIVGSSGRVDANIAVSAAIIGGTVNGDIIALEKVELGRTARVLGNIQTPRIIIEDGAVFEGNCAMLKAKEALEKQSEAAQNRYDSAIRSTYEETSPDEKLQEAAA